MPNHDGFLLFSMGLLNLLIALTLAGFQRRSDPRKAAPGSR